MPDDFQTFQRGSRWARGHLAAHEFQNRFGFARGRAQTHRALFLSARLKEEVAIRREGRERQEVVEDTVRREEIDVEPVEQEKQQRQRARA